MFSLVLSPAGPNYTRKSTFHNHSCQAHTCIYILLVHVHVHVHVEIVVNFDAVRIYYVRPLIWKYYTFASNAGSAQRCSSELKAHLWMSSIPVYRFRMKVKSSSSLTWPTCWTKATWVEEDVVELAMDTASEDWWVELAVRISSKSASASVEYCI